MEASGSPERTVTVHGVTTQNTGTFTSTAVQSLTLDSFTYLNGTAVAQWLRCCATNQKAAVSISAGVSGFFIDIKSFRSHYGPGDDSVSNRNEYQEHFLGVNVAGA